MGELGLGDLLPRGFSLKLRSGATIESDDWVGRYGVITFVGAVADCEREELLVRYEELRRSAGAKLFILSILESQNGVPWPQDDVILDDGVFGRAFGVDYSQTVTLIITPRGSICARINANAVDHPAVIGAVLEKFPSQKQFANVYGGPPVLIIPDVFEAELCERLVDCARRAKTRMSGVMKRLGTATVEVEDRQVKSRRDFRLSEPDLLHIVETRMRTRVFPWVTRSFQFEPRYIERYLIGAYHAADGGIFRAHRDNTTPLTRHRRFAVTVNLSDNYQGGWLCFPEFGGNPVVPPKGAALVFSCSLMHEVSPVTHGIRYAFLPFLHSDADAARS